MVWLLLVLLTLMIMFGGPIALGALSRGHFKIGLLWAAGVAIAAMLLAPPAWFEPVVRSIWEFLK